MRRTRKVTVHLKSGQSIEGLMKRRKPFSDHYDVFLPRFRETADRTHPLDGAVEIPRDNVAFYQVHQ